MADSERITVSYPELVSEYPVLEEWFTDIANTTAQLQDGKRMMSAKEKLGLVGGKEQIINNLAAVPRSWKDPYIVLLACRQEAMVGYEITKFSKDIGKELYIGGLYSTIEKLTREGELNKIQGLTYVVRLGSDPSNFSLSENRAGYLTTEQGLRVVARNLERRESRGLLGLLVPSPH